MKEQRQVSHTFTAPRTLKAVLATGVAVSVLAAAMPHAQAEVGVAAAVNTDARGRPPGASPRVISLGQQVVFNEQIITDGSGLVQILLLDGTTFTVGPNSQLTIDEFVYDPNTGDARVVATVAKGAFRFIGGQTSRQEGGATINTPVGTIGIRGAMVEGDVSGGSTIFSMIFGDELTFVGSNGQTRRIYEAGYTLQVSGGLVNVRPRSESDAKTFKSGLSSKSGQTGGAKQQPTNQTVANSGVPNVNSQLPNIGPLPTPRAEAVQASPLDTAEENVGETDVNTGGSNVGDDNDNEQEPPQPVTIQARVLTPPDPEYISGFNETFPVPGERGLVGSTPQSDRVITFTVNGDRLESTANGIDLPDLTGSEGDNGLQQINVTDGTLSQPTGALPAGTLAGPAYAGANDFVAYLLNVGNDPTQPFYTITGTSTDLQTVIANDDGADIRHYSLTQDPIQQSNVPFFNTEIYGNTAGASVTDFMVVEQSDPQVADPRFFLSWVDIEGQGESQKSGAALVAGSIFEDVDSEYKISAGRRGSMRPDAESGSFNLRGATGTIAGPDGGSFFGDNAENFVIGSDVDHADPLFDSFYGDYTGNPADGYSGDGFFGTTHVANLESEVPKASVERTSRTVGGFMNGFVESMTFDPAVSGGIARKYFVGAGENSGNFVLTANAVTNTVGAVGQVYDVSNRDSLVDNYLLPFGLTNTSNGGNAFVDDNIFGARTKTPDGTVINTDSAGQLSHVEGNNPGSYIISGRANPIAGFAHCPTCDFMDWGWWGTRVRTEPQGFGQENAQRVDFLHLGTWVAGDLTQAANMPTGISATYAGTAIGNVNSFNSGPEVNYVATGTFGMTYDFDTASGTMDLSNFDGKSYTGTVTQSAANGAPFLDGTFSTGAGASGTVNLAFANDGTDYAAGVLGEFFISGSESAGNLFDAIGTIMASRTSSTVNLPIINARVLTAPDPEYITSFNENYGAAGERGLVGSTAQADQILSFEQDNGRLVSTNGAIDLPDLTGSQGDTGLQTITVTDGVLSQSFSNMQPGTLTGTGYAGVDDFAAYILSRNGDVTQPFYTIAGTSTDFDALFNADPGEGIRRYALTKDPIQQSSIPLFNTEIYGDTTGATVTDLLLVEHPDMSTGNGRYLQVSVDIDGDGTGQKSTASIFVGGLYDANDSNYRMFTGRRGSFRSDAYAGPVGLLGGAGTVAGPDGGHFFGDNAENFVLAHPVDEAESLYDSAYDGTFSGNPSDGYMGDGNFGTIHVAKLVSEVAKTAVDRTSRTNAGFMNGLVESITFDPANAGPQSNSFFVGASGSTNFTLSLNATDNSVGATGNVSDLDDNDSFVSSYALPFGTDAQQGANAFVDDDSFAARAKSRSDTVLYTDSEGALSHIESTSPGSYLVSGRAAPVTGYEHCTQCNFMDWGWWGTRVRTEYDNGNGGTARRVDFAHMGTWVSGDITHPNDLPTGMSATYEGTAIGNVSRETVNGTRNYIASGDFDLSYDFDTSQGSMSISNFDGENISGNVEFDYYGSYTESYLDGTLSGSGIGAGSAKMVFTNNGADKAAGVMGEFSVTGTPANQFDAVGTVMGTRTSTVPNLGGT